MCWGRTLSKWNDLHISDFTGKEWHYSQSLKPSKPTKPNTRHTDTEHVQTPSQLSIHHTTDPTSYYQSQ